MELRKSKLSAFDILSSSGRVYAFGREIELNWDDPRPFSSGNGHLSPTCFEDNWVTHCSWWGLQDLAALWSQYKDWGQVALPGQRYPWKAPLCLTKKRADTIICFWDEKGIMLLKPKLCWNFFHSFIKQTLIHFQK